MSDTDTDPVTMGHAQTAPPIRPRERDAILQSLRAGVVPRSGQQHIQVGRKAEVEALLADIDRIADGGSTIRFVIGEYGSGKTFFLHLVRSLALERRLVTVNADLSPARRLHATGGQARSLYTELMSNLATRANPSGGAMAGVVERFVTDALAEATARGVSPDTILHERLSSLSEMVGGYDFAEVIAAYWRAHDTGDEVLKSSAVRWLRAEYSTRTEARNDLGVRTIIDDANFYDQLKLLARFVRMAGFGGLLVALDELVNLYKLANTQSRNANYEQILRILNDCLQGTTRGLGFIFGGTPDFLTDTRRGLYSYPALESRLSPNAFATDDLIDHTEPVVRLASLTPEDFYVLLGKLRHVYASGDPNAYLLPDEALTSFMEHCAQRVGDAYYRTPRSTIKEFVSLLAILEQNPGAAWTDFIAAVDIQPEYNPDLAPLAIGRASANPVAASGDAHALPAGTTMRPANALPPGFAPPAALGTGAPDGDDLDGFDLDDELAGRDPSPEAGAAVAGSTADLDPYDDDDVIDLDELDDYDLDGEPAADPSSPSARPHDAHIPAPDPARPGSPAGHDDTRPASRPPGDNRRGGASNGDDLSAFQL